jgi:hypothetical protein
MHWEQLKNMLAFHDEGFSSDEEHLLCLLEASSLISLAPFSLAYG